MKRWHRQWNRINRCNTSIKSPVSLRLEPLESRVLLDGGGLLPDLAISNVSATPSSQGPGEIIDLSWTVTNVGQAPCSGYGDYAYLANTNSLSTADPNTLCLLTSTWRWNPLDAGQSYTHTAQAVVPNVTSGNWHVVFATDRWSNLSESNENNNEAAEDLVVENSTVNVDLAISNVSVSCFLGVGAGVPVNLSWTVTNQGGDVAQMDWFDYIYLADSPTLNTAQEYHHLTDVGQWDDLGAGSSYSKQVEVNLPDTIAPGLWYVVFVTDAENSQPETVIGEGNNGAVYNTPLNIKDADLVISSASVNPLKAEPGETINVSWTVTNDGMEPVNGWWDDKVYLADSPSLDTANEYYYLTGTTHDNFTVMAGNSYTETRDVQLYNGIHQGLWYVVFETGVGEYCMEQDKTNNEAYVSSFEVKTAPDLVIGLYTSPATQEPGEPFYIDTWVYNGGNDSTTQSWTDRIYLANSSDLNTATQWFVLMEKGHSSNVAPGEGYLICDESVFLPKDISLGTWYIIAKTDTGNTQLEKNENNNTLWQPLVVAISDPDDTITQAHATSVAATVTGYAIDSAEDVDMFRFVVSAGQKVKVDLDLMPGSNLISTLRLFNQDGLELKYSDGWMDFDTNTIICPELDWTFDNSGTYYIGVSSVANWYYDAVTGTDDFHGNTTGAYTLAIIGDTPQVDLTITEAAVTPMQIKAGGTLPLSWKVTNGGTQAATSSWKDAVYLTNRSSYAASTVRTLLWQTEDYDGALAASGSYTRQVNSTVPYDTTPGTWYVIFRTDASDTQLETNEANNDVVISSFTVTPAAVDLAISQVDVSPKSFVIGGDMKATLSWKVTNQGTDTPAVNWADTVYLANSPTLANASQKHHLTTFNTPPLSASGSYTRQAEVPLPDTVASGTWYVVFQTDSGSVLPETNENNNEQSISVVLAAPTVTIDDVTVLEGDISTNRAKLTVSLSTALTKSITIDYSTTNGSGSGAAQAGTDYVQDQGSLTFAPGELTKFIYITVNGDEAVEVDEHFFVNLTGASWLNLADKQGKVTLQNDDTRTLSINDVVITEGNTGQTEAIFTISISQPTKSADVSVMYVTANGTALADSDYQSISGIARIPAYQTSTTVRVKVNGDKINELTETFFVKLSNPSNNALIGDGQAVGTIVDQGVQVISVADASVQEGQSGESSLIFTVTLSAAVEGEVKVDYSLADGTATLADGDYQAVSGTLTFNKGETSKQTKPVPVKGDLKFETNETFFLNLANPQGAAISNKQAVGTIVNDDTVPELTIDDISGVEGNTDHTISFTLHASHATYLPVSVNFTTTNDTALAGLDYQAVSGKATIAAGELSTQVTVTIKGDPQSESDETFMLNLSNAVNATLMDAIGLATLVDDDPEIVVMLGSQNLTDGHAAPLALGDGLVGPNGPILQLTVRNTGAGILSLNEATLAGEGFTLVDGLESSLAPGESDTLSVRLESATPGAKSATLSIPSDDADEPSFDINLTGTVYTEEPLLGANRVQYVDADGDTIRVQLKGPGQLHVHRLVNNPGDAFKIEVDGSTSKSSLLVTSSGGTTTINNIAINGSLGKLQAPLVNIDEQVTVSGSLNQLSLNALNDNATFHAMTAFKDLKIQAQSIGSHVQMDIGGTLGQLQVNTYASGGSITAEAIGTIQVRQGDIGGHIAAQNNIGSLIAKQGDIRCTLRAQNVNLLQGMNLDGALISAAEKIQTIKIRNDVIDSHVLAGYDIGMDLTLGAGDKLQGGQIGTFKFYDIRNSHVAIGVAPVNSPLFNFQLSGGNSSHKTSRAVIFGQNIQTNNNGQLFGFYYDAAYSRITSNLRQNQGDFVIVKSF